MRNIGILIVLFLWILLGWKMCTDYNRCCADEKIVHEADTPLPDPTGKCSDGVICFADNSCEVSYGNAFNKLKDSLTSLITADKRLRITGIYNSTESYEGSSPNLGACRAVVIRSAFTGLNDDQVRTGGQISIGRAASPSERIAFDIVDIKTIKTDDEGARSSTPGVAQVEEEISAQAVIYFPFNSTSKLNNLEIESYLDEVAQSIKGTGQRVRLTGHTDDIGDASANTLLGQRRANIVADYLMGKGVLRSQIISESKGESQPVASNNSEVGRARNRRTELQIIK